MQARHAWIGLWLIAPMGCFTNQVINISQKTALERQLMGELEPLTDEQLLLASMRAERDLGQGSVDDVETRALAARRRQLFNRDDVREAKQVGCLGETRQGELVQRPCALDTDATQTALHTKLVQQENADRKVIVDWVISSDAALTAGDRAQVTRLYAQFLAEAAQPGDWLEDEEGAWRKR